MQRGNGETGITLSVKTITRSVKTITPSVKTLAQLMLSLGMVMNEFAQQRHGLLVGLTRRISDHLIGRLRYGWYEYNETSNGGISDYIAHLGSASCTVRF